MRPRVKLAILALIGAFAILIYVIFETRMGSPLPDTTPTLNPEIGASVRNPEGRTGGPIMVHVRLHNPQAARIARQSDRTQARPDIPGIPLSTDWRLPVTFTLSKQNTSGTMVPVNMETSPQLLSTTEPETTLGVVSLMAIWAFSPEDSERLGDGQYEVRVDLRTGDLISDQYLLPDTDTLSASTLFSLAAPTGSLETARVQEDTARFYSAHGDCTLTIQHAQQAIQLDAERYLAYWYAADCLAATGDTDATISTLEQLLSVMPSGASGGNDLYVTAKAWLERLRPSP